MKHLRSFFTFILVLVLAVSNLPVNTYAVNPETFVINGEIFGKEIVCGQFTFWWSPQKKLDKAVETAVQLNEIKAVKGGDGAFCRRYYTQEEINSGTYASIPFHTSTVNGQITINSVNSGFNIVCFEAPYNGTYTYKLLGHTWWSRNSSIKVYHNGKWLTDGAVFKDGTERIEPATCDIEMKIGEKLYFIFKNTESSGFDPITFDVFQIYFHGNDEPYPETTVPESSTPEATETAEQVTSSTELTITESTATNDNSSKNNPNTTEALIICLAIGAAIAVATVTTAVILKRKNKK